MIYLPHMIFIYQFFLANHNFLIFQYIRMPVYNIDTPYLRTSRHYYPFDFLSSDDKFHRQRIFYNRMNNIHQKTGEEKFNFILKDPIMIDYLIAEGRSSYRVGSGHSQIILTNPVDPDHSRKYILSYVIFFDLEHPKAVIIHVKVY
jgi:hypothetical protein